MATPRRCGIILMMIMIFIKKNHLIINYAHCLQLAIIDVLYSRVDQEETDDFSNDIDVDVDEDEEDDEFIGESISREENTTNFHINEDYRPLIDVVRRACIYLRKPKQQEQFHGEQSMINKDSAPLNLILDVRTRWTSLYSMLERFNKLFEPILKTLRHFKHNSDLYYEVKDLDRRVLNDLIEVLNVLRVASNAFSRLDCNLLTAEKTLKFIIQKLGRSSLARRLTDRINIRFEERRSYLAHILMYLETRTLRIIDERDVLTYLERLIRRLFKFENSFNSSLSLNESDTNNSHNLEKELDNFVSSTSTNKKNYDYNSLENSISNELENFSDRPQRHFFRFCI